MTLDDAGNLHSPIFGGLEPSPDAITLQLRQSNPQDDESLGDAAVDACRPASAWKEQMKRPSAIMRLQLHEGLSFEDAIARIPYFADLGVSHLNISPIMTARAGSRGDEITDPTVVDPMLGGEAGFRRLVAAMREAGLGIIIDHVPGYMAVGSDNPWWQDVLQHGRKSAYAHYFDIDWEPEDPALKDKILLPVLRRPYGEALRQGEIRLVFNDDQDRYELHYQTHIFPIDPSQRRDIAQYALDAFDATTFGGRVRLQALLEQQHFRLAFWRSAHDAINWRQFREGATRAVLRVEEEDVFDATHATLLRLFADGLIDGVHILGVDCLADPKAYCQRLRALFGMLGNGDPGDPAYIVVDKVLSPGEELAEDWDCDGTSGRDFIDQLARVLSDLRGVESFTQWWATLSGRPMDAVGEAEASRRETLARHFGAELEAATLALHRLALQDLATRDLARPTLRRGLIELLAHLRIHRIYAGLRGGSAADKKGMNDALAKAQATCLPQDRDAVLQIAAWLGGELRAAGDPALHRDAIRRFQQLSAAVAEVAERVAANRAPSLLSQSDIGFNADSAGAVAGFHLQALDRAVRFPHAMLASTAQDAEWGEDLRARLAVLSEVAPDWMGSLSAWLAEAEPLFANLDGLRAPSFADAASLFQMLVAAWPLDTEDLRSFANRVAEWQVNALRAANLATDALVPNEAYETAARNFLRGLFAGDWPAKIGAFAARIASAAAVNGLAQTLLKLTVPGVAAVDQGTEFWDQRFGPDDHAPVDFDQRMKALSARQSVTALAASWHGGEVKQALIRDVLSARRAHLALFATGDYVPLQAEGAHADHVIAFARQQGDTAALVVASRLTAQWRGDGILIPPASWEDTQLSLPLGLAQLSWRNVLSDQPVACRGTSLPMADVLDGLPVALLIAAA